jgi:hypothetical protein
MKPDSPANADSGGMQSPRQRLVTGFGSPYVVLIAVRMVSHPNLLVAKASSFPAGIASFASGKTQ